MKLRNKGSNKVVLKRLGCASSRQRSRRARNRMFCGCPPDSSSSDSDLNNNNNSAQLEGGLEDIPLAPRPNNGIEEDGVFIVPEQVENLEEEQPEQLPDYQELNDDDSDSSMDSLHLSTLWSPKTTAVVTPNNNVETGGDEPGPGPQRSGPYPTGPYLRGFSVPRKPFSRVCRDVLMGCKPEFRIKPDTLEALQLAAEEYLIGLFGDASKIAAVRRAKTLTVEDLRLVVDIRSSGNQLLGSGSPFLERLLRSVITKHQSSSGSLLPSSLISSFTSSETQSDED